ncbi:30S ribosomal protein S9 [Candidatus Roizmanbacteria bacterium RIFCSPLOWO2_02_FULL_37_19]|uniref:30S ribosomal protein S9 n=1 Tax=Candidatus Roizmanbacteria bacterium RIFCSPHIGHO2_02_FULL_37_24 TaxID=1802037 RepID=A0A1F7GXH4_9BACT|nr:MAG: 30S ribosomal protein S9 [Candidatus Roizmanbacteria bacterium RIFCSPHIGHO2_01_FULL_38_41]OGK23494.1 MAG: 30S ribosomal protein S9 [Candidatus Roizmanbacteria bacterium RIFCSPHIGHO2_02_FULL_37_24]OGK33452.1 MAG: 30S ribosomal protein S9 [Candidatus Roizmanbacteria bacterium RIFCSPHIGHO2_12_FULL_37_23]OGK43541.1 MAG: 30S ribosomal protein S9 [Candidatus Roizmanbacteria bacterium RIFCSPLOWO2_01_FULL_37_57]OGK54030.1 MAG: 30S ribosomal protein S9 [Candidatus Roizmanbacteria bacterium RIFCS
MARKSKGIKYYEAIGRRKSAVARVRLYLSAKNSELNIPDETISKGDIFINHIRFNQYFPGSLYETLVNAPLMLTNALNRFVVSVRVLGGGKRGQLDAVILGISRALEKVDKENRVKLKPQGLLTRDARVRERRKVGTGGRARRKKQSPKR